VVSAEGIEPSTY